MANRENNHLRPVNGDYVPGGPTLAGGGDPPHDGGMEARVAKLEDTMTTVRERLVAIETKLDHVDKTMATKAELSAMESTLIKWFVATALILASLAFTAAKFIH